MDLFVYSYAPAVNFQHFVPGTALVMAAPFRMTPGPFKAQQLTMLVVAVVVLLAMCDPQTLQTSSALIV